MSSPKRVFVGPEHDPELELAVREGGGEISALADAQGIVYVGPDDPAATAALIHSGVEWLQLPHAGVEKWTGAGVVTEHPVWTSAAGAYSPQVAEHALALTLLAARNLHTYARVHEWTEKTGSTLHGAHVALIGYGGIGSSLLPLLSMLGARVSAVSDSGSVDGAERTVRRDDFRELLPDSDYVVLLAPSTPSTRGMIGAAELGAMKSDAWLVNVARGDLVRTDDLVVALHDGVIAGAALDVTDPEPLPAGHPLWTEPRAIITPHSANPAAARDASLAAHVAANTARFVCGDPLLAVIDPQAGF